MSGRPGWLKPAGHRGSEGSQANSLSAREKTLSRGNCLTQRREATRAPRGRIGGCVRGCAKPPAHGAPPALPSPTAPAPSSGGAALPAALPADQPRERGSAGSAAGPRAPREVRAKGGKSRVGTEPFSPSRSSPHPRNRFQPPSQNPAAGKRERDPLAATLPSLPTLSELRETPSPVSGARRCDTPPAPPRREDVPSSPCPEPTPGGRVACAVTEQGGPVSL